MRAFAESVKREPLIPAGAPIGLVPEAQEPPSVKKGAIVDADSWSLMGLLRARSQPTSE